MNNCYCGSLNNFENCCQPLIEGKANASSAEHLMRSRYSAYCVQAVDYLVATTHISTRKNHDPKDILEWSKSNQWLQLQIIFSSENIVEFKAYYKDKNGISYIHHERSTFLKEGNLWLYVDGTFY